MSKNRGLAAFAEGWELQECVKRGLMLKEWGSRGVAGF